MIGTLIELVKFVGGLGGLASASFLIYDRVVRYRPSAFLFPANYKAHVCFKNLAAETIIIDKVTIKPPLLKLMRANDFKSDHEDRAESWYGKDSDHDKVFVIIRPMGERSFALHGSSAEFDHAPEGRVIVIKCRWKNTRKPFPVDRHVKIKTTAAAIRQLRDASLANKG